MGRKLYILVILLILSIFGFSQENQGDSIAPKPATKLPQKPVDSTFVTYYPFNFDSVFLNKPHVIDTTLFNANDFDVLNRDRTIYSTLSNTGLAHKSMRHEFSRPLGFDMSLPSFSAYIKTEKEMANYISVLPYSDIRYLLTLGDKEQHLNVKFGRQFAPRFYISLEFNTIVSPGIFKNCKTINNYIWINAHYTTKNQRYGVAAYWYRNKLEMQENGGITNDETYTSHTESDMGVIPIHLSNATNLIKVSGAGLEHYFNLLNNTKTIKSVNDTLQQADSLFVSDSIPLDSIARDSIYRPTEETIVTTRKFTLGRICHRFNYQRNQLFFNEASPNVQFYSDFDTLLNQNKTTDTTIIHAFRNELQWNSLGYHKYNDDVPLYVYAGVEHGFYKIKQFDYLESKLITDRKFNQLSVKGGVIVNLFKSAKITGQAQFICLGYQVGDFDIKGQWRQFIGTRAKNYGLANFDIEVKRQSASWFESSYASNHFRWENEFKAQTFLNLHLFYKYKTFRIGVKQTSINNLIYFGLTAHPEQNEGFCSIREAYADFHYRLWRFEFGGFASLQKASNEDVIHLPLFLGKLKLSYSQPIFHHAATLQPSITVQYFTKYYADAYMPALRVFYLQNQVKIGNFPYIDLALSIKVKTASIYISYTNMFLLTNNYNDFIAPHYPMRNSRFFIGINWRLFN
ncbi:MAG: hypothetical protein HUK16_07235 [Bacteroidales bacterium]|nr:hypothetical protein [Bacteroidales bacterium]